MYSQAIIILIECYHIDTLSVIWYFIHIPFILNDIISYQYIVHKDILNMKYHITDKTIYLLLYCTIFLFFLIIKNTHKDILSISHHITDKITYTHILITVWYFLLSTVNHNGITIISYQFTITSYADNTLMSFCKCLVKKQF